MGWTRRIRVDAPQGGYKVYGSREQRLRALEYSPAMLGSEGTILAA